VPPANAPAEVRVLAAHLFAWAVLRARMQRLVTNDEPLSELEQENLVRWALLVAA
jgi:hypothetical protein